MTLFVGVHILGGLVITLAFVLHASLSGREINLERRKADALRDALTCRRKAHEGLMDLHDALVEELGGTKASLAIAESEIDRLTDQLAETLAKLDMSESEEEELGALVASAWGLIANAGDGNWGRETGAWQDSAARWRERLSFTQAEP